MSRGLVWCNTVCHVPALGGNPRVYPPSGRTHHGAEVGGGAELRKDRHCGDEPLPNLDMPPSRAHSAAVQSDVKQTEGGGADGGSRGGGVMIDDSDSDSDDLDIPEMGGDNE